MPYIGKSPSVGLRTRYNYTATAGQTSFTGADNSNVTLTYTDTNYTDVYLNGTLLLAVTDYASTTGTSIVLTSGASLNDVLEVVVYDVFSVADTVSAVDGGTFKGNVNFSTDVDVDGTTNLDVVDIDGAVNMATTALVTGVLTTTAATVFNGGFASNAVSTITTADNAAQLSLISTDTDASSGPRFDMYRNPGEAGADSDNIGQVNFFGLNDASEKTQFVYLATEINDAANGLEDSRFTIGALVAGADSSIIEYTQATPATGADPEIVFNNTSRDINFRVESDINANSFYLDGATGVIGLGFANTTAGNQLHILGTSTTPSVNVILQSNDTANATSSIDLYARTADNTNKIVNLKNSGGDLTLDAAGDIELNADGGQVYIKDSGTNIATFENSANALTLTDGNLVIGTAGHGIDFSATSSDGSSELLNDYEEGTFTPHIYVGGTKQTLSREEGAYVKIGDFVHCSMGIIVDGNISGTGSIAIQNFPFSGISGNARAGGSIAYTTATFMPAGILMGSGAALAGMYRNSTSGTTGTGMATAIGHADVPANWNMHFSISYRTT